MASHTTPTKESGDSGETVVSADMLNPQSSGDTTSSETALYADTDTLLSSIDATKILPLLQPPDAEEAAFFYWGLPSSPRLIGRASAGIEPWEHWESEHARWAADPNRSPWFQRTEKALASIGDHAIRRCWSTDVQPHILTAIDRLPWTSVDIFRIGNAEKPRMERPVVVWIALNTVDVPWEEVALALRACRLVLDAAQLTDVDCQLRAYNKVA